MAVPGGELLVAFPNTRPPAEYYNVDCGNKKSFAKCLEDSPNRMSIMRSSTQRFPGPSRHATPFGMYSVDTAHRKSIASCVRDSQQFYGAAFNPKRGARGGDLRSAAPDVVYNVRTLTHGLPVTLANNMQQSPNRCSIMRSKQAKAVSATRSAAPDVDYDLDSLHKATIATRVRESPILYANITRSRTHRSMLGRPTACPKDIGPGSYNCPAAKDVRVSLVLHETPLSSLMSNQPRLATDKVDPTKNLGSTWKPEHDTKHWNRGVTISRAEYLRPQYLPTSYKNAKK